MLSAREKILVEGQHDWVKLWEVHRHVAEENLSDSLAEVQHKTLELVRMLMSEGVAEVGDASRACRRPSHVPTGLHPEVPTSGRGP